MSEALLVAETGRETGTRSSRRLRREGLIPGVVYGLGGESISISVPWPALRAALITDAGVNALITLSIDGNEELSIVKDIQRHPVRRDVIHVDFIRLDANAPISVEIPVILDGEADKVTQLSGMVDQNMFSLTVNSKPADIPVEVHVDISDLEVGQSVKVSDVPLPAGVTTDVDPDEPVASGVVTRSTLEAMRADEAAEAAGEEGDAPADGDADASGDEG